MNGQAGELRFRPRLNKRVQGEVADVHEWIELVDARLLRAASMMLECWTNNTCVTFSLCTGLNASVTGPSHRR